MNNLRINNLNIMPFSGMSLGPLLEYVSFVDPSIIVTALMGSTLVFVCFSIAAMLADRGSWLFLGGTLMTLLTSMSLMTLVNIFMQSHFLYQVSIKNMNKILPEHS